MEQAALKQLLARKELMVLATGGGIVSEPLTFDLILSSFYTIWLKADPEEHMSRVRKQGDLRPMADDRSAMAELRNILVSREPLYARASAVVDTAGLSVDAAAGRLVDQCGRCCRTKHAASGCAAWPCRRYSKQLVLYLSAPSRSSGRKRSTSSRVGSGRRGRPC